MSTRSVTGRNVLTNQRLAVLYGCQKGNTNSIQSGQRSLYCREPVTARRESRVLSRYMLVALTLLCVIIAANAQAGDPAYGIAAHRAGIKTVVLPAQNKKDMVDVPKKVQRELELVFVENMAEVLDTALIMTKKKKRKRKNSAPSASF